MEVIPLALTSLRVIDPRERQLPRVEALFGLGDAVALRFEKTGKVARFTIATSRQIAGTGMISSCRRAAPGP